MTLLIQSKGMITLCLYCLGISVMLQIMLTWSMACDQGDIAGCVWGVYVDVHTNHNLHTPMYTYCTNLQTHTGVLMLGLPPYAGTTGFQQ